MQEYQIQLHRPQPPPHSPLTLSSPCPPLLPLQVLGEDLVLVQGQQDRMMRGSSTWANPVSYDKLAVRYRRWRNQTAEGEISHARPVVMNTQELFELDAEEAGILTDSCAVEA